MGSYTPFPSGCSMYIIYLEFSALEICLYPSPVNLFNNLFISYGHMDMYLYYELKSNTTFNYFIALIVLALAIGSSFSCLLSLLDIAPLMWVWLCFFIWAFPYFQEIFFMTVVHRSWSCLNTQMDTHIYLEREQYK